MDKLNKYSILVFAVVLSLNIAYALPSFDVKVFPIKDKIVVDDTAVFNITVHNYLNSSGEFTIKKAGFPYWDMYTEPLQSPITLTASANDAASVILFVRPLYITSVDTYTLDMGVVLETLREEQKVPVTIGIISTEPLISGYIPTVLASVGLSSDKIDPRNEFTITVVLNNQNVINYTNLTVRIESNFFKDDLYTSLGPKDDKAVEATKRLDSMTLPQRNKFIISVFKDQRLIVNPIVKEFEIKEYVTQESIIKEESFLKVKEGIKVASNNPDYKGTVKKEITPFKNLFLSTNPKPETINENGKQYLVWNIELGKDRTMTVYTTENYRPIVVISALIIIAIILYFVFRSPMIITKGVANVAMSEGGISEVKIVIKVKNRSSKQLTNIEVIDNVPHIAHVEKELSIGSMQPHAILQHPKKGMIIKWNIEAVEPGDERVLAYRMKSRLAILGEFNLPAANARCKINNKVVICNSNRVSVGG